MGCRFAWRRWRVYSCRGGWCGGVLEVLSENVDGEEDSDALDVEAGLLESDEAVWEIELEVLEATSLLEDV